MYVEPRHSPGTKQPTPPDDVDTDGDADVFWAFGMIDGEQSTKSGKVKIIQWDILEEEREGGRSKTGR